MDKGCYSNETSDKPHQDSILINCNAINSSLHCFNSSKAIDSLKTLEMNQLFEEPNYISESRVVCLHSI